MIKLVCSNIERSKHLDTIPPFVEYERPDVWCVQEVVERDIPMLARSFGSDPIEYAPMLRHRKEEGDPVTGVAVFSRLPVAAHDSAYYVGVREHLPDHDETPDRGNTMNCALAWADIQQGNDVYRIGTTHFTWSEGGWPTDLQRRNVSLLLKTLKPMEEIVFCGDFNAPRGRETFATIAANYKDNIPAEYTTSIDKDLHRAGDLQLMVDGLFSTPGYAISDVKLHSGVSDHLAITAMISKA